jgi:hypothetical protein
MKAEMGEQVVNPKIYIWTCIALLVLLAVTWSIAYVNLGPFTDRGLSRLDHQSDCDCAFLHAHQGKQPASAPGSRSWRDVAADPDLAHAERLFYARLGSIESLAAWTVNALRAGAA